MTGPARSPIRADHFTVGTLYAALAGEDSDTRIVVRSDAGEYLFVREVGVEAVHEFYRVDESVITLPAEWVVIIAEPKKPPQCNTKCSTLGFMADWTHRGEYITAKHDVTPQQANEALNDPNAVIFDPDYNSNSGDSVRTIGYSISARHVLSVLTIKSDDAVYGANAWQSNSRDRHYYQQGGPG